MSATQFYVQRSHLFPVHTETHSHISACTLPNVGGRSALTSDYSSILSLTGVFVFQSPRVSGVEILLAAHGTKLFSCSTPLKSPFFPGNHSALCSRGNKSYFLSFHMVWCPKLTTMSYFGCLNITFCDGY